jgi:hypothetical protein
MASVMTEGPMPNALSIRRTSPLIPGCRHHARLALAQGAHDLEALDRGVGCRHRFETTHGLDQQFELAMVGLEHVVQVFYLPVFGFQGELPSRFNSAIATP